MKRTTSSICSGCLLAIMLLGSWTAYAQANVYYQSETATAKGYWRLKTSVESATTSVTFFDAHDQPIYQEYLPGHYVTLNKRTVRLLDDFLKRLEQLESGRLLAAQLKTELVPFSTMAHQRKPLRLPPNYVSGHDTLQTPLTVQIHCSVTKEGKIRLNLLNPTEEALTILLADDGGQTIYKECTSLNQYYSRLDVSNISNGDFKLTVSNQKGDVVHAFGLRINMATQYELLPLRSGNLVSLAVANQ